MQSGFLRRQTNYPGGIAAGGGDTGWFMQPQPTLFTLRITANGGVQSAVLPAGAQILERWVLPDAVSPCTVGTVDIDDLATSVSYGAGLDPTTVSASPMATPGTLSVDTRFTFTPNGIDGAVAMGFLVIMPRMMP